MREIKYDFPYVTCVDDMFEKYSCIVEVRADMPNPEFHPNAFPTFSVKFDDGTVLTSDDTFTLIRKVNAYLKYMLNDDIVSVYDSHIEVVEENS